MYSHKNEQDIEQDFGHVCRRIRGFETKGMSGSRDERHDTSNRNEKR